MKILVVIGIAAYALSGCDSRDDSYVVVSGEYDDGSPILYVTQDYIEKKRICDERPDQPMPEKPDITPSMYEYNRPAEWQSQMKYVADTCYVAATGTVVYKDEENNTADYYSIDVEVRKTRSEEKGGRSEAWSVIFRRDFRIEELPAGFEKKPIDEIVSFDGNRKSVNFNMGGKIYEYRLPLP